MTDDIPEALIERAIARCSTQRRLSEIERTCVRQTLAVVWPALKAAHATAIKLGPGHAQQVDDMIRELRALGPMEE